MPARPTAATACLPRCCTCCCTRSLVIGTFAVVTMVGRTGDGATDLASFRGLGKSHPVVALAMTVLLLAQAGVPLTSGFVAKFAVIQAAVEEHSYAIAIVAMVASVIAAFLYLRIMVSMWVTEPESDRRQPRGRSCAGVDRHRPRPVGGLHPRRRLLPHLADRRHQSRRHHQIAPPSRPRHAPRPVEPRRARFRAIGWRIHIAPDHPPLGAIRAVGGVYSRPAEVVQPRQPSCEPGENPADVGRPLHGGRR